MRRLGILSLILVGSLIACTEKKADEMTTNSKVDLTHKGKLVYVANCTSCHNLDPRVDGSLGPSVAGSSLDLIRRRIVNGDYPPGHEPKRHSRVMVALPHLSNEVEALHAYLNN